MASCSEKEKYVNTYRLSNEFQNEQLIAALLRHDHRAKSQLLKLLYYNLYSHSKLYSVCTGFMLQPVLSIRRKNEHTTRPRDEERNFHCL